MARKTKKTVILSEKDFDFLMELVGRTTVIEHRQWCVEQAIASNSPGKDILDEAKRISDFVLGVSAKPVLNVVPAKSGDK